MILVNNDIHMLLHVSNGIMIWYKMNDTMDNGYICGSTSNTNEEHINYQLSKGYVEIV